MDASKATLVTRSLEHQFRDTFAQILPDTYQLGPRGTWVHQLWLGMLFFFEIEQWNHSNIYWLLFSYYSVHIFVMLIGTILPSMVHTGIFVVPILCMYLY